MRFHLGSNPAPFGPRHCGSHGRTPATAQGSRCRRVSRPTFVGTEHCRRETLRILPANNDIDGLDLARCFKPAIRREFLEVQRRIH